MDRGNQKTRVIEPKNPFKVSPIVLDMGSVQIKRSLSIVPNPVLQAVEQRADNAKDTERLWQALRVAEYMENKKAVEQWQDEGEENLFI